MDPSIRLGKIFGIPLGINYSWLVVFALVIFLLAGNFEEMYPRWSLTARWLVAFLTAVLFFLSVLAHELSHSLVALAWKIPVRGITLFIFGGVSQLDGEAQRPLTEFLVTIVGPATSLLIALVMGTLVFLVDGLNSYLEGMLLTLFLINLTLGIFNLLPGFPLDGGRVLRACIWGMTGNFWLATRLALLAGQGTAIILIVLGIILVVMGDFNALWVALVGGFLLYVATKNYRQEALRQSLKGRRVTEAISGDWSLLPGDLPAVSSSALMALFVNGYTGILVGGPPFGVVTGRTLTEASRRGVQDTTLSQVMTPLIDFPILDANTALLDALELLDEDGVTVAAVIGNGVPLGLVTRIAILEAIRASRGRRRF